jgi:hypothetical protein
VFSDRGWIDPEPGYQSFDRGALPTMTHAEFWISRNYIEDFDKVLARAGSAPEVIDAMMEKYSTYGNPYTLFAAAWSQFGD